MAGVTRRTLVRVSAALGAAAGLAGAKTMAPPPIETMTLAHADGRRTRYRMMLPRTAVGHRAWPIVIFSHGANSGSTLYDRLWTIWAVAGFVVIGCDHIDSGPPAAQQHPREGLWQTRVADLHLPFEQRMAFDRLAASHGGRLDWTRVAAAGHSFGAVVAQGLAGATVLDPVDHRPSAAHLPAVRACLAFSPPGALAGFVPADAWDGVHVPALLQTGDADVLPGFVDDWHVRLAGFTGAADRWTLVGHGVDHYFGGLICRLNDAAGRQAQALAEVAKLSALFLQAYLDGSPTARAMLAARARRGDDGIAIFADASHTAAAVVATMPAGHLPAPDASAFVRRGVLTAALTLPLWPALAMRDSGRDSARDLGRDPGQAAVAAAAISFAPSDIVPLRGVAGAHAIAMAVGTPVAPHALAAAQAFSDGLGGTALLVAVDGRIVHERYAAGFDARSRLKTYSMAKSVLGLVYGLAVADRVLALDDPLGKHLAELAHDARGTITLRQLLQMRSGLKLESLARHDPRAIELVIGRHVTRDALATPLVGTPGATFEYNNANSFLAGLALDRALQRAGRGRYAAYLADRLWRPLGEEDATLEVEAAPDGEPRFFAGLDASARDWMRIGSLFVTRGKVGRRQLVPADWLATMTTPSPNPSYGMQMWIGQPWTPLRRYGPATPSTVACREPYLAPDLVFFDGSGGQRVYMVPSRRLVIVRTGAASPDWEDSALPNSIIRGMA